MFFSDFVRNVLRNDKDIIVMSPTVDRAVYEWKAFLSRWSTIIIFVSTDIEIYHIDNWRMLVNMKRRPI